MAIFYAHWQCGSDRMEPSSLKAPVSWQTHPGKAV